MILKIRKKRLNEIIKLSHFIIIELIKNKNQYESEILSNESLSSVEIENYYHNYESDSSISSNIKRLKNFKLIIFF